MQPIVAKLLELGPLPDSMNVDVVKLELFERLISQIDLPISDDDAKVLVTLLGPDECFGLAWTLVHIIETSPGWPLHDALNCNHNDWIETLKERSRGGNPPDSKGLHK
ncbi:hypothetical protein [Pannonibacter phragmitetus]|uniref:hypothetical protein n=1 Tax=Pannonibacter phragmitetus TaxID=121719 RepID=UPI0013CEE536|nr:hypothetical protein [Pannonibacter phragmitetus]